MVPPGELDTAVRALVDRLLAPPAGAMRETLGLLAAACEDTDLAAQLRRERGAQYRRLCSLAHDDG